MNAASPSNISSSEAETNVLQCKFSYITFSFTIWLQLLLWQYGTSGITALILLFLVTEFKKNCVSEDGIGIGIQPAVKPVE